jgi:hypothetical protein
MGSISRSPGGTIDFTLPSNPQSGTNGITTTTGTTNGILGGWATVEGTNWATTTGTADNITAYSAYTTGVDLGMLPSNVSENVQPTGLQTSVTAAKTFNSLDLTGTIGVTMSGGSLTLLSGGLLGNTSGTISGGVLVRFTQRRTDRIHPAAADDRQHDRRQRRGNGADEGRFRDSGTHRREHL